MKKSFISFFLLLFIGFFSVNLAIVSKTLNISVGVPSAIAQTSCPSGAVCIENPLEADTFEELVKVIIKFLQALAGVVTAMVIVLAGYFFVTSMGDPAKVTQAKKMVLYALIGLAIILAAQGIIALIETVIKGK